MRKYHVVKDCRFAVCVSTCKYHSPHHLKFFCSWENAYRYYRYYVSYLGWSYGYIEYLSPFIDSPVLLFLCDREVNVDGSET